MTQNVPFSATQMGILMLLEADDINGQMRAPIPGRTHLVKELFVIFQTELGKKLLPALKFEPDNFGPYDETIFAALDGLKDAGFVNYDVISKSTKIKLTDKGKEVSDAIWADLKPDIKVLFSYAKRNYNHLTSERLLDKIYSAYPEMAENSVSEVAKRYRLQKG